MGSTDVKTPILRRMFLEAIRHGKREPQYGFQTCPKCGGHGVICIEQKNNDRRAAAITESPDCKGETIVPSLMTTNR